jgi:hypothetical protein
VSFHLSKQSLKHVARQHRPRDRVSDCTHTHVHTSHHVFVSLTNTMHTPAVKIQFNSPSGVFRSVSLPVEHNTLAHTRRTSYSTHTHTHHNTCRVTRQFVNVSNRHAVRRRDRRRRRRCAARITAAADGRTMHMRQRSAVGQRRRLHDAVLQRDTNRPAVDGVTHKHTNNAFVHTRNCTHNART